MVFTVMFLGVDSITAPYRYLLGKFYCPFGKTNVEVTLRPSIFTYRPYDDLIRCSEFNGKITCKRWCLDLTELQANKNEAKRVSI
jgi:hypothetical protein